MIKVKVLHISEPFISGIYTYIKHIAHFSENQNIQTFVIYSNKRNNIINDELKSDFNENTTFFKVAMDREISFINDFISFIKIIKVIYKIKPDVIHLHSSKAGVIGRVAGILYPKAKLFYTPNGYSFIREDISSIKKIFFRFLENLITKIFLGTIIACGDQEFEEAQKLGKSSLVRNGVYVDEITKFKIELKNTSLTIGTSGRISIQKNPKLFNEIALKLPQYNFVWIGDGDLKDKLTASNITITGWKKGVAAIVEVNKLDIFISTSSWEGLPFNIIEAMALSKPIVSSNIKANLPTIIQNKNGYVCSTIDEFEQGIKSLENQNKRKQFGNESLKICNELFNLEKNFVDLIRLYKS